MIRLAPVLLLAAIATAAEPVPAVIRYTSTSFAERMLGGRFQGSDRIDGGWVDLYRIGTGTPSDWDRTLSPPGNDLAVPGVPGRFRFLRYLGPDRGSCNIAELRFLDGIGRSLDGMHVGTMGSFEDRGDTLQKAFDGDPMTRFDAPRESGCWVGVDLGDDGRLPRLALRAPQAAGSLAGQLPAAVRAVAEPAAAPGHRIVAVEYWLGRRPGPGGGALAWTRAARIEAAPWTATLAIAAPGAYEVVAKAVDDAGASSAAGGAALTVASGPVDEVRFYSSPWANIAGCRIQGGDAPDGRFTDLATIPERETAADGDGFYSLRLPHGRAWRCLRFLAVAPACGHIADLRFCAGGVAVDGVVFSDGKTGARAFDYATAGVNTKGTYFDDGSVVGIDLGPQAIDR